MQIHVKDPGASLDYSINWGSGYLGAGENITTSSWEVFPADMTISGAGNSATLATINASGGVTGRIYQLTNRITTSGGRTDERSIAVRVEQR